MFLKIKLKLFLKLKKFTKAYMILNDIIEGNFYLSPSQDFYFYRLKRKIEDRFIATIACKAAVKAHMKLSQQEVDNLLNQL